MSALKEAANKMLKMLEEASLADPALAAEIIYKIGAALPSFRAALEQEQDAELSAALGWLGGISNPVLDRVQLLQMVAALRVSAQQALEALEEYAPQHGRPDDMMAAITALRAALAQEQAEPVVGWMDPESEDVVSAAQRAVWAQDFGVAGRRKAGRFTIPLRACLAQEQAEPLTNQCGETCERAKLCATCARELSHE